MKIKLFLTALLNSVCMSITVVPTVAQARVTMESTEVRASVDVVVEEIETFWYTWTLDEVLYPQLTSTGVLGFMYNYTDHNGVMQYGKTSLNGLDVLPSDWEKIYILSVDDHMNGIVFAVNHGDGSATLYDPY